MLYSWWGNPDARADQCLREHLTPEAYTEFFSSGRLRVRGESGRVYVIAGESVYDSDGMHGYCAKPDVPVPYADLVLLLKLYIETNEEEFLRIANCFRLTRPAIFHPEGR